MAVTVPLLSEVKPGLSIEYYLAITLVALLIIKNWSRSIFTTNWRSNWRVKRKDDVFCYDTFEGLPSLPMLPVIGCLHHLADLKDTIQVMKDAGNVYGPVFKGNLFSEVFVGINNAEMTHTLLSSTDMNHLPKSPFLYDAALGHVFGTGLITSHGPHWKMHRKQLNPCFSYQSFQNYTKIYVKNSKQLITNLEELFKNCGEMETRPINQTIHKCHLQIITEAVMGLELFDDKDGPAFYDNVKRIKEIFSLRLTSLILMLDFFWKLHPLYKEYDNVVNSINTVTRKMITKQREFKECSKAEMTKIPNPTGSCISDGDKDSLSTIHEQEEEFSINGKTMIDEMIRGNMSDLEILHEVNTLIFAGYETTSTSTQSLLFLLALHPEHQKRCREEVLTALADPMKCPNGELTYDAITDLKYLEMCYKETLRLYPPAFVLVRKLDEPLQLSETLILPKGVNAGVSPLLIHKNPEYFPQPEKFIPDRFLPENVRAMHPGSYIPFSTGPRSCIGMKFATMAVKTLAAQILRNFDIYTTDKVDDVILLPSIFLTPERDYNFILKKRKDNDSFVSSKCEE